MPILAPPPPPISGIGYSTRYLSVGDFLMATGAGALNGDGTRWVLESINGWDGSPAPIGDVINKVGTDGAWLGEAFYGPRIIEVVGSLQADWETANAAIDKLNQTVPISGSVTVTIGGAGPERQADVRQNGELLITGSQSVTRFSMSLIAADPRKYSTSQTVVSTGLPMSSGGLSLPVSLPISLGATVSSGRLDITNDGNVTTPVLLAVQGPCPAFSITHVASGRQLGSPDAVPAGRTLYMDSSTRIGLLDGTALRLVTGTWFDLDPGENQIQFTAATYDPAAQLTASYRSAWR